MQVARFTVVTPVLNGARFVAEAIRSVRAQSYESWRCFVMDGGSSDDTVAIANRAADGDPRIVVRSRPDRGMYDAVLEGLAQDDGDVCYWLNADDMVMPWAFEVVSRHLGRSGVQWLTGAAAAWDERGALVHVDAPQWYPRRLVRAGFFHQRALGFIPQESTFFTRRLLGAVATDRLAFIRGLRLAGDFVLWAELAKHAALHTVPTVLAGFRMHDANAGHDMDAYFREVRAAGFAVPPASVGGSVRVAYRSAGPALLRLSRRSARRA